MLKIALTGGIGSGKTTVAQIFEVLSVPVYYADGAAKYLMNTDALLKEQITAAFGPDVYTDGNLDRSLLGKMVFSDPEKLALLNALVHPVTLRDAEVWMQKQHTAYAIKEAAIIFEAGIEKLFDYIIGVSAPENLRLERVMKRDHTSSENVLRRMAQQMDENEKMSRCDFVVVNDGVHALLPQVLQIHETLRAI
jgi:dephospho-CoA kinase